MSAQEFVGASDEGDLLEIERFRLPCVPSILVEDIGDLTEARRRILDLAEQLPRIWHDPRVDTRERKRIVRLLIDDVTLIKAQTITAHVRLSGGTTRTLV